MAPIQGYKVQHRTLPDGAWSNETTKSLSQLSHEYTGLTQGQSYEVRVRSYHSNEGSNVHRWGYATVYTDDCANSIGTNTCEHRRQPSQERPHQLQQIHKARNLHRPGRLQGPFNQRH